MKRFFSYHGTMGRAAFFGSLAVIIIFSSIISMLIPRGFLLLGIIAYLPPAIASTKYSAQIVLILYTLINLVLYYPIFCITTKRLHDLGRSGWWQLLLAIISVIAAFFFAILLEIDKDRAEFILQLIYGAFIIYLLFAPQKKENNPYL